MWPKLRHFFEISKSFTENLIISTLIILSFCLGIVTYLIITKEHYLNTPDPNLVISVVLIDLITLLALVILLGRKLLANWYKPGLDTKTRLYNQISLMCAGVSFVILEFSLGLIKGLIMCLINLCMLQKAT